MRHCVGVLPHSLVVVARPGLEHALRPLLDARVSSGFSVRWLDVAAATTLRDAPGAHVLLVGHPQADGAFHLPMEQHAPPYRHMKTPFHGDHAWIHGSLDTPPRHAVGRLPVRRMENLETLVRKLIAPPPPVPNLVTFVDGHPGWHPLINRACEVIARHAATSTLPSGATARRASFNPGAPPNLRVNLAPWLSEGGPMFVYVGHGQPGSVDGLKVEDLPPDGGQHAAVVLACCHAGTLAAPAPSLAEQWLLKPGGPRTVLAASNVSDPRLNPALAWAYVQAALTPGTTAGEALLAARHAVLGAPSKPLFSALRLAALPSLRHAHQGLYNLLGDPTFVLTPLGVT
jgi:hypothetical protein